MENENKLFNNLGARQVSHGEIGLRNFFVEIYHAKFRHSGMKNKEVMFVLVIRVEEIGLSNVGGWAAERGVNRVKGEIQGGN